MIAKQKSVHVNVSCASAKRGSVEDSVPLQSQLYTMDSVSGLISQVFAAKHNGYRQEESTTRCLCIGWQHIQTATFPHHVVAFCWRD